jgi:hypothetical protein
MLADRALKYIVVGIDEVSQAAWRCLDPNDSYKVYVSRDVAFGQELNPAEMTPTSSL